jgi:hypothetical protein
LEKIILEEKVIPHVHSPLVVRLFFISMLLLAGGAVSAQVETWKVYTSKRNVRDITVSSASVWAATSGGLFSYSFTDGSFQEYTTSDGLQSIDLTAIIADNEGRLWIGTSDGWLQGFHPRYRQWEHISDIVSLNNPNKRINRLQVKGDTLFILSDVGVSLYSLSRREFKDTYLQFGSSSTRIVGNATSIQFYQNKIWVSTLNGIASTDISNPNPSVPESWQVYKDSSSGLPSPSRTPVVGLVVANSLLFAATNAGLYSFSGIRWQLVPGTEGRSITDVWIDSLTLRESGQCEPCPDVVTFITSNQLWSLLPHGGGYTIQELASGFSSALTTLISDSLVATQSDGIFLKSGSGWKQVIPEGPISNSFVGMVVDENGSLWSGTGAATNLGFMKFDGRRWKNYLPGVEAGLAANQGAAHQVDIGPNNTKWVSLWGSGVVLVGADDSVKRVFDRTAGFGQTWNPLNDPQVVVIYGVVTDRRGDVWVNIRDPLDQNVLAVYSPQTNSFRYIKYPLPSVPILPNIIEDHYGTKWFTSASDPARTSSPGLVFYDETLRLPRRLNDSTGWGIIKKDDGLTSNLVSAVAVDNDGSLWVGSPEGSSNKGGISIIVDPLRAPERILIYHPLQDQNVNDILVDPLNRKWIATDQGIFLLSPDGTSILGRYTVATTNGILPDNRIVSLAMNRNTGALYIGTEKGLAVLTTPAVTPLRSYGNLTLYPNPYYLPSNVPLTVDGLTEGSTLKILTANGDLVKEIKTAGGRIGYWDGKDEKNAWVASAIYLVVAYSDDGKQVATGKLAVVRK